MPVFRVHSLVEPEFAEARAWYDALSPLAALNFAQHFDRTLARVASRPTSDAPWRSILRRARLPHFLYLILFYTDRRFVSVLALVHHRREPTRTLASVRRRLADFDRS